MSKGGGQPGKVKIASLNMEPTRSIVNRMLDELFLVLHDPQEVAQNQHHLVAFRYQLPMVQRNLPKSFFMPAQRSLQQQQQQYQHQQPDHYGQMSLVGLNNSVVSKQSNHQQSNDENRVDYAATMTYPDASSATNYGDYHHHHHHHPHHPTPTPANAPQPSRMVASIEVTSTTLKYQLAPTNANPHHHHYHHHPNVGNARHNILLDAGADSGNNSRGGWNQQDNSTGWYHSPEMIKSEFEDERTTSTVTAAADYFDLDGITNQNEETGTMFTFPGNANHSNYGNNSNGYNNTVGGGNPRNILGWSNNANIWN